MLILHSNVFFLLVSCLRGLLMTGLYNLSPLLWVTNHLCCSLIYKMSYNNLTIRRLSNNNVKVTFDLRWMSNLQNILRRSQGFPYVQFTCKIVRSSEMAFVNWLTISRTHNRLTAFCPGLPGRPAPEETFTQSHPSFFGHPLSSSSIYNDPWHPLCSEFGLQYPEEKC